MEPTLIAGLGLLLLFALIALHVPIGPAMGLAGVAGFAALAGPEPALAIPGIETVSAFRNLDLGVIPLFLLMGSLASVSGLSDDLYALVCAFLGHRRGGLAVATIGGSAAFGAVCGSSIATVATMTRVALPEMVARGTERGFAAGTIAAGGTLGVVIPPSVLLVIYALLSEQFVLAVFAAAIVPGLIAALLQMATAALYARLRPGAAPALERLDWRARLGAVRRAWAVLLLALILSGALYGGVVTVTEAAALGAVAACLLALVRGRLTGDRLRSVAEETAVSSGMIYVVIIGAFTFSYFLAVSGLPEALVAGITGFALPPLLVVFALYLMYLALGAVFDPVAAMVVTLPFVLPVIEVLGYDPVWWGVMLVMVSALGMITPPIGINVFVLKGMAPELSLGAIYRGVLPFLGADLVRVVLLTLFPVLATWLPRVMGLM